MDITLGSIARVQGSSVSDRPLLLVQQGEQGPSRHILGDDGELAGVVQTRTHKLDDAGVVETTQDGHLSTEHVHIRLGAERVGTIPAEEWQRRRGDYSFHFR